MAQFDVHPTVGAAANYAPYLIELQSEAVAGLASTIVAPMRPVSADTLTRLHVPAALNGKQYEISVEELVSMPRASLTAPVANLAGLRNEVVAALDFLFTGY